MAYLFETLHHAAAAEDDAVASVEELVGKGHDVNATDKEGRAPLHIAARRDNLKIIQYLLDHGADVMARMPRGFTALHYAVRHARIEIVALLIARGADVNAAMDHGLSVAHISAEDGRIAVFKLLVEHGANVLATMVNGSSVLRSAIRLGRLEIVQYLIEEQHLEVNVTCNARVTLVHDAAVEKQLGVLEYLLGKGADIHAVDNQGRSALHRAIWGPHTKCAAAYAVARMLCQRGVVWDKSCTRELAQSVKVAATKTSRSSDGTKQEMDPSTQWRLGLRACVQHWEQQQQQQQSQYVHDATTATFSLMEIPIESVKRGAESVATYLANMESSRAEQLVLRRKICVVGPSEWGKTSLVKSLTSLQPSLVHIDDRTIGIDLFAHSFTEQVVNTDGDARSTKAKTIHKRHEVTFWDFAGQDEYQVAHAMFFSKRTLYLLCVDLEKYNCVRRDAEQCASTREGEHAMARFLRANVFRWVRAIVSRQADAEFVVVGTKLDKIHGDATHATRLWCDLSCRLSEWMKTFADEIEHEVAEMSGRLSSDGTTPVSQSELSHFQTLKETLQHLFTKDWLVVSSASVDSITQARNALERKIVTSGSDRSFLMPAKYTRVLEWIRTRREQAARLSNAERIADTIVPVRALCNALMRAIEDLEGDECREILQTLHDLGDLLWYEHEASGVLRDTVILDPTLVLDFVREVITHEYAEKTMNEPAAFVEEGRLTHALVQRLPLWRDVDDELTFAFKQLLQYFQLAYPADNADMDWDSDLIIPTYWKVSPQSHVQLHKSQRRLVQQHSMVQRHGVASTEATHFCWEYELSAEVSETVFEHFAVQSYSSVLQRRVRPQCIEAFVHGDCAVLITLTQSDSAARDIIRLETAVADAVSGWQYLRYYVMALETVLDGYPGLLVSRYIIDTLDNDVARNRHRLTRALNVLEDALWMGKDDVAVRQTMPWLPTDMNWFIEKAWRDPGALQQLRTQELVRETVNKLDVLTKLVVADDVQRRYPALWTLQYEEGVVHNKQLRRRVVRVRMLSDLSGECFHEPIDIELPSAFFAKYGSVLQTGLSIVSNVVPEIVSLGIVQKAIGWIAPVLDDQVARAEKLYNLIDQLDLSASGGSGVGVVEPAASCKLSPRGATSLLRELLTLHDSSFDELTVSDLSKLQCAATADGHYVWANRQEIMACGNQLTPCDPQDTHGSLKRTLSSTSSCATDVTSTSSSSETSRHLRLSIASVTGFAAWDWRRVYCKWQLVHDPTTRVLASGATPPHVESSVPPSWASLAFTVSSDAITSDGILSKCRLSVRVKRPSRCLGVVKLLAEGSVPLSDTLAPRNDKAESRLRSIVVPLDCGSSHSKPSSARSVTVHAEL